MSIGSIPLASAFLFTITLVAALCRLAPRIGLVDAPTARKRHHGQIPVCGGLAMFFALLGGLAVRQILAPHTGIDPAIASLGHDIVPLLGALAVLVAIGGVDDRWGMEATTKLALQLVAVSLLLGLGTETYGDTAMMPLPATMPGREGILAIATVIFFVGLINAFNMIDGLDGLAGGLAAIALIGLAAAASLTRHAGLVEDSLLLVAVVLGFLVFNLRRPGLRRAKAFMGDAGSMMLGCAVAAFVVELSRHPATGGGGYEMLPALLWLVAIPMIDTISLMIRRPLAGRSPMAADREHLHHLLLDFGLSPSRATAVLIGVAAGLAAIGVAGLSLKAPATIMLAGLLVPVLGHGAVVWACTHRRRGMAQAVGISSEPAE